MMVRVGICFILLEIIKKDVNVILIMEIRLLSKSKY